MNYTNNQVSTLQDAPTPSTMLEGVLRDLSAQNSRLITTISAMERVMDKAHPTPPQPCESANKPQEPNGLFEKLYLQIQYLVLHNVRLEEAHKKLSELI